MRSAFLYRLDSDRRQSLIGKVDVPADVFADIERNYRTDWLQANGFDPDSHFLRSKPIIETTAAERRAFERCNSALKRAGLAPSALGTIAGKLASKA